MGYITEFNWVLKLKPEQGLDEENLEVDKEYSFNKKENRIYPLNIPLLLVNNDWEAIGTIEVLEFITRKDSTKGRYKILKIHKGIDKEVLTRFLKENQKYKK